MTTNSRIHITKMENLVKNKQIEDAKSNEDSEDGEEKKKRPVVRSATDLQRLKLEKLMKNPDKPVVIPEPPKERDYLASVPTFVRNVMGSSAGAGSGEFHVYRHLRRKEYARQKCIQAKSMKEQLDDEYRAKLERNRLEAEAKTAKKRAKRLKKKKRAKKPKTKSGDEKSEEKDPTSDDDDDTDESPENAVDKNGELPEACNGANENENKSESETAKEKQEEGSPEKEEKEDGDQNAEEVKEVVDNKETVQKVEENK